jgi:hypothetical protein
VRVEPTRALAPGKMEVTERKGLSRQVCVPKEWPDDQVKEVLDAIDPSGTESGWHIRKVEIGDPNYKARVTCEKDAARVHIVLDA